MKPAITFMILTFIVNLYSQQNLYDSLNLNPPKKKIKSREIYFGRYLPFFNVENEKTWSGVFESDLAADSTYYSYQYHRSSQIKIEGSRGLTLGYNRKQKIFTKLYFKTGLGLNIMNMKYYRNFTNDTVRVLNQYKLLQSTNGEIVESIKINDRLNNYTYEGPFRVGSPYQFVTASLQIPLGLEYTVSSKVFIGTSLNYNFIFQGKVFSVFSNSGKTFENFEETDLITRYYVTMNLYCKYNIYKNFFIDINGALGSNPFKYTRGFNVSFLDGAKSISTYHFGLRIGYNF